MTPTTVEHNETIKVGKIIRAGSALPLACKMPRIVVGINCNDVAAKINNIIIGGEALVCSGVAICSIAEIAAGVAAPDAPIIFAAILVAM